jgi:uncharacterized protein YlxP (DUF503 family)
VAYVCLLEIHLHLHGNAGLKGKRRELASLKAQLQRRFGASVAETDHHDLWQRATLTAALVGRDAGPLRSLGASLGRYVEASFPDGSRVETRLVSADDLGGG